MNLKLTTTSNPPGRKLVQLKIVVGLALVLGMINTASAISLLDGFGGPAGYGQLAMSPNDDGSSSQLNLPFTANFFGNNYNSFFINNNGNLTFNGPVSSFTPQPFPISSQPMIAPFWADVDTRCSTCGAVYVAAPNSDTVVVTWNDVGYFSQQSIPTNNFQTVLRNQGGGNFDVDFRYDRLAWTTGSASAGIPAQAGYDAGDGVNFFTLPGSRTAAIVDLETTSNVSQHTPGLWSFAIRNGALPGQTSDNPLMPIIINGQFQFNFNIQLNQRIFIDPPVAIGYDYVVGSGPNIASVLLPGSIGDGIYDLFLFDTGIGDYVDSGIDIVGGVEHFFGAGGVNRFSIRGIEPSAGLDPNDPTAFVTGLTFNGGGQVSMQMIPISIDVNGGGGGGTVPEPSTLLLLGAGLLGVGFAGKRQRKQTH